jgi:hypothetical protein
MKLVIDIPYDTERVDVLCDGIRKYSTEPRYRPGNWNGLNGGTEYGQYFDIDNVNRVNEMIAVACALKDYGVKYNLSKLKRRYRITISEKEYKHMDKDLKDRITRINIWHDIRDE